jgi:hypothetical protein
LHRICISSFRELAARRPWHANAGALGTWVNRPSRPRSCHETFVPTFAFERFIRTRRRAPQNYLLPLSAKQWPVAPLVRALGVPSHLGLSAASLSSMVQPISFAAEPTAQVESVLRKFVASTPPTSRDMGTDRHCKLAHPPMADRRRSQPQLSRLPTCVDSALHPPVP